MTITDALIFLVYIVSALVTLFFYVWDWRTSPRVYMDEIVVGLGVAFCPGFNTMFAVLLLTDVLNDKALWRK